MTRRKLTPVNVTARYRGATANGWGADLTICPDCQTRGGHDDKCPALV